MSTIVKMETLPACDFCGETAGYDARTKMGPWAYMCESCFNNNGTGQLGTGYGQRLVKDGEDMEGNIMRTVPTFSTDAKCYECGRVFNLLDDDEAGEWFAGHDCEPDADDGSNLGAALGAAWGGV